MRSTPVAQHNPLTSLGSSQGHAVHQAWMLVAFTNSQITQVLQLSVYLNNQNKLLDIEPV